MVSGVLVGGGWCYQLTGWAREVTGGRKRDKTVGMINGNALHGEDED